MATIAAFEAKTKFGEVLDRVIAGEEIVITALPLYHVYALTCNCLAYTELGGHDVLIPDPRDLRAFIRELRRWKFTAITGVNTLYQRGACGRLMLNQMRTALPTTLSTGTKPTSWKRLSRLLSRLSPMKK